MEIKGTLNIQSSPKQQEQGDPGIPDLKLHSRVVVTKTAWPWCKKDTWTNRIKQIRNQHAQLSPHHFHFKKKNKHWGKGSLFHKWFWETEIPHKKEDRILSLTLSKSQAIRAGAAKLLEKHRQNPWRSDKHLLFKTSKSIGNRPENWQLDCMELEG